MNDKEKNIEVLESTLSRLDKRESVIYFLVYDTKNNPRAAIKNIYDMALVLKETGFNPKILVEDKKYTGVSSWLGDEYNSLEIVSIKEDQVDIKLDDIVVVPEHYSNILEQLSNVKCVKVMLVQLKEYMFETLQIGSRWSDFGFDKCITTTEASKKYIMEYFPETLVYLIPPFIDDNVFTRNDKPIKPFVAISCRDRVQHKRIVSEFYLKFPHLRWITFRDMIQMSYEEFGETLKECMVSIWLDDESTFGTFPLESMKCGVPVIGKVPYTEPDWIGENGIWTYDNNKIVDLLGSFIMSWVDGIELSDDVKKVMGETVVKYSKEIHNNNTIAIFNALFNKRIEIIQKALDNHKKIEE